MRCTRFLWCILLTTILFALEPTKVNLEPLPKLRGMEKIWSKREKQIDKVIKSIGGMHGDLEGVAGPSLPVVKMLERN